MLLLVPKIIREHMWFFLVSHIVTYYSFLGGTIELPQYLFECYKESLIIQGHIKARVVRHDGIVWSKFTWPLVGILVNFIVV